MDLGKNLQQSFNVYLKNFGLLFLTGAVALVISGFSLGILAGPMFGGFIAICLKLLRDEKAEFSEIFGQFNKFLPTFILSLLFVGAYIVMMIFSVVNYIPFIGMLIGFLINLAVGPVLGFIFVIALGYIVDKGYEPIPAVKEAFNVFMSNPLKNWLYVLVFGIVSSIGMIPVMMLSAVLIFIPFIGWMLIPLVCAAGMALTLPLGFLGLTTAFQDVSKTTANAVKIDKKVLQIAGISLAAVLGLGLLFFALSATGIYRSHSVLGWGGYGFGNRAIVNTPFGQVETKPGSESVTFQTKNGPVSAGAGLPADFPKDIPLYPNAKAEGHFGGISTLTTTDGPEPIVAYYSAQLASQGWAVETSDIGPMKTFTCKKDDRNVTVTVNPEEGKTNILITVAK